MKRTLSFGTLAFLTVGAAWTCYSVAQDPGTAPSGQTAAISTAQSSSSAPAAGAARARTINGVGAASAGTLAPTVAVAGPEFAAQDKIGKLVRAYQATEDQAQKDSQLVEIQKAVEEQFDLRQTTREKELKQLEDQLKKLHETHIKRAQQKDKIVSERVTQLIRESEGLGWGSSDAWNGSFYNPGSRGFQLNTTGQFQALPSLAAPPIAVTPQFFSGSIEAPVTATGGTISAPEASRAVPAVVAPTSRQ